MSIDFPTRASSVAAPRVSHWLASLVGLALLGAACAQVGLDGDGELARARSEALSQLSAPEPATRSRGIATLRDLAEGGDAASQHAFAVVQARGMTGQVDVRVANFWWRRAAEQGVARAQYSLGTSLRQGRGVGLDSREAMRWVELAAEQGHPIAQYDIAFAYTVGFGTERDFGLAKHWFEESARAGHVQARAGLVRLHTNEVAGYFDAPAALMWIETVEPNRALFAEGARAQMDSHRARLEEMLSESERYEARRQAESFRRRHPVLDYTYWDEAFLEGLPAP